MSLQYIHLRVHSEYSITQGMVRIKDACKAAAEDQMPALALTDISNLFGVVKFYKSARKVGVKPIIGCDAYIRSKQLSKPFRKLFLVQDQEGYLRLSRWLTRAFTEGESRDVATIDEDWICEDGSDGLILLSGWEAGDIGSLLSVGNADLATTRVKFWNKLFPDRYYIEIQRPSDRTTEELESGFLQVASSLEIPVVATHPVEFLRKSEYLAHEARVCISGGHILADQRRPRLFSEEHYFKSQQEMLDRFSDVPEAIENTLEIAKRCSLEFKLGVPQLPPFPTPEGMSLEEYLTQEAERGLDKKLEMLYPEEGVRLENASRYRDRLKFEIATIVEMGFPGYFLIVADFINWAKNNGVPVGPGRGSGAGSLVAYSLGITDLDPLQYNLLFERFLNPERVSMPDFDIDFCQDGRDRVIDYVRGRYGADSVSQIATFGTMAAKAVVRDVARVMEWPYGRADELAKLIPFQPGQLITLESAKEMEPRLKEREENDEETRELLKLAEQLEGLTRNVGMHAGGVLIAPSALSDFCPLYRAEGSDSIISHLDKDDVEEIGLVKFDFLGLTTLTVLDWTLRFIRRLDPESKLQLSDLPLNDASAYKIFSLGNTAAVFQFESRGMRDLILRAKPDRFEDIVALVALFRPGPMDLIPDFVERKHGRQTVNFPDERVRSILEETYGIMVYQEQVMQMAQIIGGYSLGGADLLRRAMGKKKPEEMAQHRQIFKDGAKENGLNEAKANEIFDLMEKFAGYGFNKSHAAAYALIAYQTAFFKAHHLSAFMAANMSTVMDDTDRIAHLHDDSIRNQLKVLPPDINSSEYRFVPLDKTQILYGLGAVRGTGEAAINHIISKRESGAFVSFFDFCCRVDRHTVNRRVIEALVKAGAFDKLDSNRARLLASVDTVMSAADQKDRDATQGSLFSDDVAPVADVAMIDAREWSEYERLQQEKTALGFFYSGHPFKSFEKELSTIVSTRLNKIAKPNPEDGVRQIMLAGVVDSFRFQKTQNGRMLIVTISDGYDSLEVVFYDEVINRYRDFVIEDSIVIIEAKMRTFRRHGENTDTAFVTRISADAVYDLASIRTRFARSLKINVGSGASADKLKEILSPFRSDSTPVCVTYTSQSGQAEIDLGPDWRVTPDEKLIQQLGDWLSPENVSMVYN